MTACGGYFAAACFEHIIPRTAVKKWEFDQKKPLIVINHHFCKIWVLFGYDILRIHEMSTLE